MLKSVLTGTTLTCVVAASSVIANAHAEEIPTAPAAETPSSSSGTAEGHENILAEIVVTGVRRRTEDVQTTPIAITALNEDLLARDQITSVESIARNVPNLIIQRQLSTANQVDIYLRGFGNQSNDPAIDPPVALYVDGIYQPIASGTQMDTFGVGSIEVDRGPQGTLLGKNAPTGAVSINARRPTGEWSGQVEAGYERFDHKEFMARIDVPLVRDVLAMNASLAYKRGGDFIRDLNAGDARIFGGENVLAARVGILFTPIDEFEWLVQMNGENTHNPQTGMRDLGFTPQQGPFQAPAYSCAIFGHCSPTQPFTTNAGFTENNLSDDRQISSQMTLKLHPVIVTSVTGYKTLHEINKSDVDGEPVPILDAINDPLNYHQFSQELRVSSAKNGGLDLGGRLDWVLGGYFSDFHYTNGQQLIIFAPPPLPSFQDGRTKSHAAFAHLIYSFTDQFNVTVGGRQTWDDKNHSYIGVGETAMHVDTPLSFRNFSKEAGAQYKFTPDKMVYFRYAEGYRGGGYQGLPAGDNQVPYRPETVKSYEVGAKTDYLDHHLRANVSIFQNDYTDVQRTAILSLPVAPFFGQFIQNAANAKVRGVELETTLVPTDALTVSISGTYLDPHYENYFISLIAGQPAADHSNFPFPYSPRYSFKLAPQYFLALGQLGSLTLSADWTYTTSYYCNEVPYPLARVGGMGVINASITYNDPSNKYYARFYGQNLTDRRFIENYTNTPTAPGGASLFSIGADHKPLTWGISIGARF